MRLKAILFALLATLALGGCEPKRAITADPVYQDPKHNPRDPALSEAHLVVVDKTTHSFAHKALGSTTAVEIVLFNAGVKEAENISVDTDLASPFRFRGGVGYPGTGGSCGVSLASETSCSFFVEFTPNVQGIFSSVFVLDYESDGIGKQFSFGFQGSSGSAALAVMGASPTVFDNTLEGDVRERTLTIINNGALTARFMGDGGLALSPFRYKGGSYPGTGGDCGEELASADTCTIVLEYAPTSGGIHARVLAIAYLSGGAPAGLVHSLQGTSGTSNLSLVLHPADVGTCTTLVEFTGNTRNCRYRLTNSGTHMATGIADRGLLSNPLNYRGGSYPGTGGSCSTTLAAGSSCEIQLSFAPTLPGETNVTLEIEYDDGQQTRVLTQALSALAQGAVLEALNGDVHSFSVVPRGTVAEATLTITNTGNIRANALAVQTNFAGADRFRYKGFLYPGTGGNCGAFLNAGASCTVVIEYFPASGGAALDPVAAADPYRRQTVLRYNPGNGSTATLTLAAEGRTGLGLLSNSGQTTSFGARANGTSVVQTLTIANSGGYPVTDLEALIDPSAPFSYVGGSYPGTNGTCGDNLAPGGQCTLHVAFAPTSVGDYNETLGLQYFNGATQVGSWTRNLTGSSGLAVITLQSGDSYDFGARSYGTGAMHTYDFVLTNQAGTQSFQANLTLPNPVAPFTRVTGFTGNCGATLAVGASCVYRVRFNPTAVGMWNNQTINLSYFDGQTTGIPLTLTVSGEGVNDAPVSHDVSGLVTDYETPILVPFSASDANQSSASLSYVIVSGPASGSLSGGGASRTYTPDPGFDGADSFTYRVCDTPGACSAPSTVSITVNPAPPPPPP